MRSEIIFLCFLVALGQCNVISREYGKQKNVVTVPPNCPEGQELVNGACRDIWKSHPLIVAEILPSNVVSVPPNCAAGQEYVNGACRDVWRREVQGRSPVVCAYGQEAVAGECRNVVSVPPNCATGQEYINGACRDVWRREVQGSVEEILPSNVVSVPPNCAAGQEYINGACRDVWRRTDTERVLEEAKELLGAQSKNNENQQDNKNIISVPNQCPTGYRPDSNGICREIWGRKLD